MLFTVVVSGVIFLILFGFFSFKAPFIIYFGIQAIVFLKVIFSKNK